MRLSYYVKDNNAERELLSITEIKKLIEKQGGYGYTEHYERDGTLFDVTEIELKGNNSNFKYNKHL